MILILKLAAAASINHLSEINMRSSIFVAALLVSGISNASLVELDWKQDGDGLATYDSRTNQSWLDLSETSGKSVNDVESLIGSLYAGWRLSTRAEVAELLASAIPDAAQYSSPVFINDTEPMSTQARYFNHFLGESDVSASANPADRSFGYFKSGLGDASLVGSAIYYSYSGYSASANQDKLIVIGMDDERAYATPLSSPIAHHGVFLVSDTSSHLTQSSQQAIATDQGVQSVSAPFTTVATFSMLGLIGVGLVRRRRVSPI
jgi:hypothetical protein